MHIRPAVAGDREFVLQSAARLLDFGDVPGRDRSDMLVRDRAVLGAALDGHGGDAAVLVAVDDNQQPLGFIHLTTADDYYSDSHTAHVADIVVAREAEGRGVGAALIAAAEQWAAARGFALLTLNVFSANRRAREFYARLGFGEEWIRCIKRL